MTDTPDTPDKKRENRMNKGVDIADTPDTPIYTRESFIIGFMPTRYPRTRTYRRKGVSYGSQKNCF